MSPTSTEPGGQILVVDDEEDFRTVVAEHLSDLGHSTSEAGNGEEGLALARVRSFGVALVDLKMPGMGGVELLEALKGLDPLVEVIIATGHGTIDTAIETMKRGAYDYLLKPCRLGELEVVVAGALEKRRLRLESARLREQIRRTERVPELVGQSPEIEYVRKLVGRVAPTDSTVLVLGETGTGKELVAHAIHRQSSRTAGSFLVLQAGAVPDSLIESELFGHVRGAFTGATNARQGLFELADRGTLFIDEIGEMPLPVQSKLLRILESPQLRPVGGEREVHVNVRFIAATNRDLKQACARGEFREDLYFRLNVMPIWLPPLRERKGDIPLLVEHYLARSSLPGAHSCKLSSKGMQALMAYSWPGNVRELFNVLERALILADGGDIGLEYLPPELLGLRGPSQASAEKPPILDLESVERQHILRVLGMTRGNKVEAAKLLKIPRRTLYRRLEGYGMESL